MNRTQFVIDAVSSGAIRELDKLENKEKQVASAMKEIGREAQVAEYKVAEIVPDEVKAYSDEEALARSLENPEACEACQ